MPTAARDDAVVALGCLAVVVVVVLMAFAQPVVAGCVLLVVAAACLAAASARSGRREAFCVGCGPAAVAPPVLTAGREPPALGPPAAAGPASGGGPVVIVHHHHGGRRARRHRGRRRDRDADEPDREGFAPVPVAPVDPEEEADRQGWVRGMAPAPPRPAVRRPMHAFNPKSLVNADTDGNPATCGLVIRDHFRPGGDQAMVLKPRFPGWIDPGLGRDTSTPRRAMEAQRQVFQRNVLGFRNALLWPMYQSSEYQLRGINGRANVYDCGGSGYSGIPTVPVQN